jgi:hypothetical protein
MSTKKTIIGILFFVVLVIGGVVLIGNSAAQTPPEKTIQQSQATAEAEQQDKASNLPENPVLITEDFWTAGQSVEIKSEGEKGDVVVAGADVKISGKVHGYLMAAGATVRIDAPVGNDLWAAGANVIVNAPVADNAMIAGNSVLLDSNAAMGKNVRIAASFADVRGRVSRNLTITAANARISSEIDGNVTAYAENLTLYPGAVVRGDLVVYSPNEPTISGQAQVLGRVDYHRTESGQSSSSAIGNWFGSWFLTFLWITILGLIAVWFSSVWTGRVTEMLKRETAKSFLVGLIAMLAVPILFILLLITVAGLPLAFLLGAMSLVAFLFSGAFISYFVGDLVLKRLKRWEDSNVLKIVFGAFIVTIVMSLPLIGWLAKLAVLFFGVGAFLLERRDLFGKLREQGLA